MNVLAVGDWHLTDKCPENRIDKYEDTTLFKLKWILVFAQEKKVSAIIQPGDFFDTPNPSYALFTKVVNIINSYNIPIYTVFGQHDLRYRNAYNTGLFALQAACPNVHVNFNGTVNDVEIRSAGWGEPIPKPKLNAFNILITHRMIIQKKLWEGQEDFDDCNDFLKTHKFNLIVSGDNHQFFTSSVTGRKLINCGSLLRSSIAQINHEPKVVLLETSDTTNWAEFKIPILPADKVFKMEEVAKTKERNKKLELFVEGLSQHKEMGLSFEANLNFFIQAQAIDGEIQTIIKESMI